VKAVASFHGQSKVIAERLSRRAAITLILFVISCLPALVRAHSRFSRVSRPRCTWDRRDEGEIDRSHVSPYWIRALTESDNDVFMTRHMSRHGETQRKIARPRKALATCYQLSPYRCACQLWSGRYLRESVIMDFASRTFPWCVAWQQQNRWNRTVPRHGDKSTIYVKFRSGNLIAARDATSFSDDHERHELLLILLITIWYLYISISFPSRSALWVENWNTGN